MSMKKIAWMTPSAFVDVDLPIIAVLRKTCIIYWQVMISASMNELKEYINSQLSEGANIRVDYVINDYKLYDPRSWHIINNILSRAKSFKPDLFYTSIAASPFTSLLYKSHLPLCKTIAACHNVHTPKGAAHERYNRIATEIHLRTFQNIQVFSDSQREVLLGKYPQKNVLLAPLAIKDYGEPTLPPKKYNGNEVVFLFFGIISPYKRLDLLIEAAQSIYEQGYKNFKVKIAGKCKAWPEYASLIKYQNLFDNRIEFIPNSDVANIFAECNYFVMPYQDIAQSGAITVAYRYNLPIILSDLPQFRPFGVDGVTGFFFESGNAQDLGRKMIEVINGGAQMHDRLKNGLSTFVKERYSTPAIANKYLAYFEELLNK